MTSKPSPWPPSLHRSAHEQPGLTSGCELRFPFGAPVHECGAGVDAQQHDVFVLGAYPSALHVRWSPPVDWGLRPVAALAVDNEPLPFWTGDGQDEMVRGWRERYASSGVGEFSAVGHLNGSSGLWLDERVLQPAGWERSDCFITDCLTTYRLSAGQAERIGDQYEAARQLLRRLPVAVLPPHPDEDEIVDEATTRHAQRLHDQLDATQPDVVITLGNAAARTFAALLGYHEDPRVQGGVYGADRHVTHNGYTVCWLALAHPGAPQKWQMAHGAWVSAVTADGFQHEAQPGDTVITVDHDGDPSIGTQP